MAKQNDVAGDLSTAAQNAKQMREEEPETYSQKKKEYYAQRRVEAMTLRLAGLSYGQIAERMEISTSGAYDMVKRSFQTVEAANVDEMRELENHRLDRAQAAIWPKVLKGDEKSIGTFLNISGHRARINGLNSPTKVDISMGVRTEMETALNNLEEMVLEAEVIEDAETVEPEPDGGPGSEGMIDTQREITAEVIPDEDEDEDN